MSQNTKSLKGERTQARKRQANVAAEQKVEEPLRKRGRPSKQKNTTTRSLAGTSKKIKTAQKTPEAVKELTPVTPTETPPSAKLVPIKTSNKKKTKKQKQLPISRRSNPPREVSTAARAFQLQKTVAPILIEESQPRGRGGPKKKQNQDVLKKTKEQLFQPEAEADVAVVDYGLGPAENLDYVAVTNNNNDEYLLAEEVNMQCFYV